jgi:hypothetical protein
MGAKGSIISSREIFIKNLLVLLMEVIDEASDVLRYRILG